MTTSILNDCLLLKNQTPDKLQEYLHSINLTIFDNIFHNSSSTEEAKQKIFFILAGYSEDSPLLILRQDSNEEKEGICEYLQIPDFMRKKLKELSEPEVRRATTQYLSQFANPLFKSLMFMKIQYEDIELTITNRDSVVKKTTTTGETTVTEEIFDNKEHSKAITELSRLGKAIEATERQLRSQSNYPGLMEMKDWKNRGAGKKIQLGGRGISIENSSLIKKRSNG